MFSNAFFFRVVLKSGLCGKELIDISSRRKYSITCIQRPFKASDKNGLLQHMVFKCRFYLVDLRRVAVSEQWSLKAGGLLIPVVSDTGVTVSQSMSYLGNDRIAIMPHASRDLTLCIWILDHSLPQNPFQG